jgi:Na+-transporting methylmalonyl-CoA/oxaloacetate decarboxylase gamma subunit
MFFNYTNAVSSASRGFARWLFIVALLLIGFGVLILAFPEVFAFLAALVFFITGLGVAGTAIKIYLAQRRFDKMNPPESQPYRENVKIHTLHSEEHYDI